MHTKSVTRFDVERTTSEGFKPNITKYTNISRLKHWQMYHTFAEIIQFLFVEIIIILDKYPV